MANWIYNLLHGKLPGKGFLGRSSTGSGPGELLAPAAARALLEVSGRDFATVAAAEAETYTEPEHCVVKETGKTYVYDAASTATVNHTEVLAVGDAVGRLLVTNSIVTADQESVEGNGSPGNPLKLSVYTEEILGFFNGVNIDPIDFSIASPDGINVYVTIEKFGGGDIHYKTSTGEKILASDPAIVKSLTPGTDASPASNYFWINSVTNTVEVGSDWPSTEYCPIGEADIASAAFTQTDGVVSSQVWTDHVYTIGDNGHLTHINEWIRNQYAKYVSGMALGYTGSGTNTVNVSVASGEIRQLHEHVTPAISSPAPFYVWNDETSPGVGTKLTNLFSITTDAAGNSNNNSYAEYTFFFAFSETGESKLYVNKPLGTYSSLSLARSDAENYRVRTIPTSMSGTACLVWRLICKKGPAVIDVYPGGLDDLRGVLPGAAGGNSISVATEFSDDLFRVQKAADTTAELALDLSSIQTATTRSLTLPDRDVDLGKVAYDETAIATEETSIADADEVGFKDTSISLWKRISWANILASIKTYTDTLYVGLSDPKLVCEELFGKNVSAMDYWSFYGVGTGYFSRDTSNGGSSYAYTGTAYTGYDGYGTQAESVYDQLVEVDITLDQNNLSLELFCCVSGGVGYSFYLVIGSTTAKLYSNTTEIASVTMDPLMLSTGRKVFAIEKKAGIVTGYIDGVAIVAVADTDYQAGHTSIGIMPTATGTYSAKLHRYSSYRL